MFYLDEGEKLVKVKLQVTKSTLQQFIRAMTDLVWRYIHYDKKILRTLPF